MSLSLTASSRSVLSSRSGLPLGRLALGSLAAATLVAGGWICAPASAAESLTWKFAAGEEQHYRMTQDMTMDMNMGAAGQMQTGVNQTIDMTWKVLEMTPEGNAKLSQKIDRMQVKMNAPGGQSMDFDSASGEAPQGFAAMLAPLMTELTKASFEVTMSPRGEVLDVTVPDDLIKALQSSPGAAMMGDMVSKEGFKQLIEKGTLTLPAELNTDTTWSTEVKIKNPMIGTQTVTTTYAYAGSREVDGQTMEVFKPSLKMEFGDENGPNGMKVEVAEQKSSGEILFNRAAGRIESSQIDMAMDMKISVNGQQIDQTIDQKIWMEFVEPEELAATKSE